MFFYIYMILNAAMMAYWLWNKRSRGYAFPFFAGGIAIAMLLPQGIALLNNQDLMPEGAFDLTMIFASLCTVAIWIGFRMGMNNRYCPRMFRADSLDDDTLYRCALVFTIIGVIFRIWLENTHIQTNENRQWTGIATVLHFFSLYTLFGMMIGMYLYLKRRRRDALVLALICVAAIIPQVIFRGRRAVAMQLLATFLIPLWFVRKRAVPRWMLIAVIVGMAVVLPMTGDFRRVMLSKRYRHMDYIERLNELDVSESWDRVVEGGGGLELLNCVYGVSSAHEMERYDFGLPLWNWVVWSYVPAQFVGRDFKRELYIDVNWPKYQVTRECYPDYEDVVGSMWLGYTDAFQSYWWLGWLPFFVISWFMGWLYRLSEEGSGAAICLYTWYITPSLHIIPSMTYVFWTNMVYLLVFCLPIMLMCKRMVDKKPRMPNLP